MMSSACYAARWLILVWANLETLDTHPYYIFDTVGNISSASCVSF